MKQKMNNLILSCILWLMMVKANDDSNVQLSHPISNLSTFLPYEIQRQILHPIHLPLTAQWRWYHEKPNIFISCPQKLHLNDKYFLNQFFSRYSQEINDPIVLSSNWLTYLFSSGSKNYKVQSLPLIYKEKRNTLIEKYSLFIKEWSIYLLSDIVCAKNVIIDDSKMYGLWNDILQHLSYHPKSISVIYNLKTLKYTGDEMLFRKTLSWFHLDQLEELNLDIYYSRQFPSQPIIELKEIYGLKHLIIDDGFHGTKSLQDWICNLLLHVNHLTMSKPFVLDEYILNSLKKKTTQLKSLSINEYGYNHLSYFFILILLETSPFLNAMKFPGEMFLLRDEIYQERLIKVFKDLKSLEKIEMNSSIWMNKLHDLLMILLKGNKKLSIIRINGWFDLLPQQEIEWGEIWKEFQEIQHIELIDTKSFQIPRLIPWLYLILLEAIEDAPLQELKLQWKYEKDDPFQLLSRFCNQLINMKSLKTIQLPLKISNLILENEFFQKYFFFNEQSEEFYKKEPTTI